MAAKSAGFCFHDKFLLILPFREHTEAVEISACGFFHREFSWFSGASAIEACVELLATPEFCGLASDFVIYGRLDERTFSCSRCASSDSDLYPQLPATFCPSIRWSAAVSPSSWHCRFPFSYLPDATDLQSRKLSSSCENTSRLISPEILVAFGFLSIRMLLLTLSLGPS